MAHNIVIPLRFVCKLCNDSCRSLENFIEHKKEVHFEEFQKTKLIVFEEVTNPNLCPTLYPDPDEKTSTFNSECANIQQNILNLNFEVDPLPDSKLFLNISHADADIDIEAPISGLKFSSYYVLENINADLNTTANVIKVEGFEEVPIKTEAVEEAEIKIESKTELVTVENVTQNEDHDIDIEDMEIIRKAESEEEEESVSEIEIAEEDTDESFILCDHPSTSASETFLPVSSANISYDFECQLCSKLCKSPSELSTHSSECVLSRKDSSSNQAQDGNTIRRHFPCQLCSETFLSESHFISHMQIHKIEEGDSIVKRRKFKCPLCSYETNRLDIFKWHVQTHPEGLPYKCPKPHCGKSFKAKPYLFNHLAAHSNLKKFPCLHPNCGKTFKTLKSSKNHLRNIHLTKTKPFKCEELQAAV